MLSLSILSSLVSTLRALFFFFFFCYVYMCGSLASTLMTEQLACKKNTRLTH